MSGVLVRSLLIGGSSSWAFQLESKVEFVGLSRAFTSYNLPGFLVWDLAVHMFGVPSSIEGYDYHLSVIMLSLNSSLLFQSFNRLISTSLTFSSPLTPQIISFKSLIYQSFSSTVVCIFLNSSALAPQAMISNCCFSDQSVSLSFWIFA